MKHIYLQGTFTEANTVSDTRRKLATLLSQLDGGKLMSFSFTAAMREPFDAREIKILEQDVKYFDYKSVTTVGVGPITEIRHFGFGPEGVEEISAQEQKSMPDATGDSQ